MPIRFGVRILADRSIEIRPDALILEFGRIRDRGVLHQRVEDFAIFGASCTSAAYFVRRRRQPRHPATTQFEHQSVRSADLDGLIVGFDPQPYVQSTQAELLSGSTGKNRHAGVECALPSRQDPSVEPSGPLSQRMTLLTLWWTTFAVCVVGSFIPLVNTEIYLLSVSAISPAEFVGPLVVAATVGQMAGKVVIYYGGRGILRIRNQNVRGKVIAVREKLEQRPRMAKLILFSSAIFGLPPLYLMSIACGAVGMGLVSFILIGSAGRLIHFTIVAMLPQYAKYIFG